MSMDPARAASQDVPPPLTEAAAEPATLDASLESAVPPEPPRTPAEEAPVAEEAVPDEPEEEPTGETPAATAAPDLTTPEQPPVSAPDVSDADATAADVIDRLQSIERSVGELQSLEERHLGIIEKLHADNTELRQGELTQAMKPLLLGIGQLHDDVSQMIAHAEDDLQKKLMFIRELTLDLLERHGVTPLDPEPRSPFDPKQHTAVSGVPADDPELHGTVAVVERIGFVRDGQHLVRPAQVSVHRHTPRKTVETQDSPPTQRIED